MDRQRLNQRADMHWRRYLGQAPDCRPQWWALHKPPLSNRQADLQWRVLPINSFMSTINETVEDGGSVQSVTVEINFDWFYEYESFMIVFFFYKLFFKVWGIF